MKTIAITVDDAYGDLYARLRERGVRPSEVLETGLLRVAERLGWHVQYQPARLDIQAPERTEQAG